MNRLYKLRAMLPVLAGGLWLALTGCSDSNEVPYEKPDLSDGVIFIYPINGQTDVPLGTRFYVTFSKNASQSAVNASCSMDGGGNVTGNFCLLDSNNNLVTINPQVNGKVVQFETPNLLQGTRYRLFVRSPVIGGSTNLPASDALLSFTTSQIDPVRGVMPRVTAINGENPDVYLTLPAPPSVRPAARYPFMDFATLRVEFSEPLDEKTVRDGSSFQFMEVDGASEIPVTGALMVRKQHVVFDPEEDLKPGVTYRLHLSTGVRDLNGDALAAASFELVPQDANACNCVIIQHFNTTAAYGEAGFPQTSAITGRPMNAIDLYSPLIGSNDINLRDSTLQAELADPSSFGGLIPFVIRKGNVLDITGLDLALGGAVPANLSTSDIRATFLSDATGFMGRNPYRSADTKPDDEKAPLFVYLIFDLVLSATDERGNAVLNQTIPHVQATGTARVVNGNLQIETVRTLTMDLLGLDLAPAHMVLGISSDLSASKPDDMDAPRITGAYPADGAVDFPIRDGLSLIFSEAISNAGVVANDQIQLLDMNNGGAQVPFQLAYDGSTVLLKPDNALGFGRTYHIVVGALTDISESQNGVVLDSMDATGGDGIVSFTTENPSSTGAIGPMVTSISVGAPCVLTGSSYASPGHCVGGAGGDTHYVPFDMPADGYLDVQFNQVMNINTLVLGTSCNSGRVRVEMVDGSGNCTGVVNGSLIADTRSFRFTPAQPWVVGANYRLTLVSGGNASCDSATEICGNNNLPLNPDPLNGGEAGDAGGSNPVIRFRGVAANDDVYLPLKLEPYTDLNGNGFVNGGEVARIENSARVAIPSGGVGIGFGGIVTNATFLSSDRIYLNGALPVTIGQPEPLSINGADWNMVIAGHSQIPVQVHPSVLYGTSITMGSSARVQAPILGFLNVNILDTNTGVNILRLRETGGEKITGYIVQEAGVESPQFVGQFDFYMDAPDMNIQVDIPVIGGLFAVNHSLHSMPLSATLKGPVTFLGDGRILIELASVSTVGLTIDISSNILGILNEGYINLSIGAGDMRLSLIGNPLKGRR